MPFASALHAAVAAVSASKDGKLRVVYGGWDDAKAVLPGEVLELRWAAPPNPYSSERSATITPRDIAKGDAGKSIYQSDI
jgi:hypothetical protein